jgi:hypothetical protein
LFRKYAEAAMNMGMPIFNKFMKYFLRFLSKHSYSMRIGINVIKKSILDKNKKIRSVILYAR